jgi:hypothetical protein
MIRKRLQSFIVVLFCKLASLLALGYMQVSHPQMQYAITSSSPGSCCHMTAAVHTVLCVLLI